MPDPAAQPLIQEPALRRVVVVLGMHRSGTSLVAGCLQRLGVDFGPRLMPPNADNPRGYFEHKDVVNLHDRLLLALDRSWDDPSPFPRDWLLDQERLVPYREPLLSVIRRDFPAVPLWGLKDPRLCRLLPWWETLWPETDSRPLFILVRRAPQEVADSLARREGMSAAKAHLLWLRHVLEAERWTRPHERLLVDFADFRADEPAALEPIRRRLALPAIRAADPPTTLVDPTLGRVSMKTDLPAWVEETDTAMLLGLAGEEAAMRTRLDTVQHQIDAAEPFLAAVASPGSADLLTQLTASRKQARWYEEEWRKASARVTVLQERAERKSGAGKKTGDAPVVNEKNISNMIIGFLSNLINR